MAKRIRTCLAEMRRQAKSGKMQGNFSVYADQVTKLQEAGFEVTLPRNYNADDKKNPREVMISWANPTSAGSVAAQLNKTVVKYRNRQNAFKRTKVVKGERAGSVAMNWIPGMTDTEADAEQDDDGYDEYDYCEELYED